MFRASSFVIMLMIMSWSTLHATTTYHEMQYEVENCFTSKLKSSVVNKGGKWRNTVLPVPGPVQVRGQDAIIVENTISLSSALELHALSSCVELHVEANAEKRVFYDKQAHIAGCLEHPEETCEPYYRGGNDVVYIAGFFQNLMPEVYIHISETVSRALHQAGWSPSTAELEPRCVEHLTYTSGSNLNYHEDSDSVWTIVLMLSDMAEYEGGEFQILREEFSSLFISRAVSRKGANKASSSEEGEKEDGERDVWDGFISERHVQRVSLALGDLLIIPSERSHAVSRVGAGIRRVFVMELWPHVGASAYDLRPPVEMVSDMLLSRKRVEARELEETTSHKAGLEAKMEVEV